MWLSGEMREIFYELDAKIRKGKVEQPLFHTLVQCLYLKREMIEELMRATGTSPTVRIHCELFLDWLADCFNKQPRFPFDTAQSDDSLQEKVRALSLPEQLFLFDVLEDLRDAANDGDRENLLDILGTLWIRDSEK